MQEQTTYKQQRHHYSTNVNGGGPPNSLKRPQTPMFVPQGHIAIRVLCHVARVGGLIGKSGSIIRQLQQETSAKIRVEDLPNSAGSNSDVHRVILIVGSASVAKRITLRGIKTDNDSENGDETVEVSAAQEAAVRVFERVIEVAAESDGVVMEVEGLVSCRLLMERGQVGTVIGKGGKNIEMIKKDTSCRIKVLNKERLPACALPNDVMVEFEGDILAVKRALIAVTRCLQDYLPANRGRMNGGRAFELGQPGASTDPHMDLPMHRSSLSQPLPSYPSGGLSSFLEGDGAPTTESRASLREVVFNILCPNDRVGGVIGKAGSIVKTLENESGASINVSPGVADSTERLITISSMENLESRYSPAQSAVILVFNRFVAAAVEKDIDSKGSAVSARLVVQANEVGCLLGKGGAIISEMRKVTGASLRIIGGDQVPKCAIGNVEVVQITGAFVNVQNALYSVTSRLRDNLLPFKMPNSAGSRSSSSSIHESSSYGGVRGPPPVGFHSSGGVSHDFDQHSALVENMDQLRLTQNIDRPPSPKLWTAESVTGANQRSILDVGRQSSAKGGVEIGSGSRSAIVTSTTVEIIVPDNVINSIYGENGSNLSRLRQISGAKVIVHEPSPGSSDRTVVISGSPDQTQAAQSLLQAFILTGSS